MPKNSVRRLMLDRRKSLAPHVRQAAGDAIQAAFLTLAEFDGARLIILYAPVHHEVATADLLCAARRAGKVVLFPRVAGEHLEFRQVDDEAALLRGTFGILEPDAQALAFTPEEADIIVIPGVAFDLWGNRIGYGKGFYDRALHQLEGKGRIIGFCYDFQLVEEIRGEPHDVRVDMVITEQRVHRIHPEST